LSWRPGIRLKLFIKQILADDDSEPPLEDTQPSKDTEPSDENAPTF